MLFGSTLRITKVNSGYVLQNDKLLYLTYSKQLIINTRIERYKLTELIPYNDIQYTQCTIITTEIIWMLVIPIKGSDSNTFFKYDSKKKLKHTLS